MYVCVSGGEKYYFFGNFAYLLNGWFPNIPSTRYSLLKENRKAVVRRCSVKKMFKAYLHEVRHCDVHLSEIFFIPRLHEKNIPHLSEILFVCKIRCLKGCLHELRHCDVLPDWDAFYPAFTWEKYPPPEWGTFRPSEPACLILSSYVAFIVYLLFCLYFKFEFLINIHAAKLYRMNCTFLRNKYKNTRSLN